MPLDNSYRWFKCMNYIFNIVADILPIKYSFLLMLFVFSAAGNV